MNIHLRRQACYNLGMVEPISIEPDGTVWLGPDDNRTYPDPKPINAEYVKLVAQESDEQVKAARRAAYEQTSDPVFFKWQRGEATEADWQAAVASVKAQFPA